MQLKYLFTFAIVLAVIATKSINVEARRLKLRPLSAREVYRILKEAGREDAIPEGRVVTQGIAAITGFALGITKGIGGSLLFDLATSNATSEFINNLNLTALTGILSGGSIGNSPATDTSYQTQEICFNSRSLEPGEQPRNAVYNEYDKYGRQAVFTSPTLSSTGSASTGSNADANSGVGGGTNVDTGIVSNSVTNSETDTGTGASQTCIVIQKPNARKRRSSHRRRRH